MRAFLVFLLFCGYALGARWYYVCQVKGLCGEGPAPERLRTLTLQEGDTVRLRGYDQFLFDSAAVAPRLNADNRRFLDSVAAFLQRFPEKKLDLTARYRPSEAAIGQGFFENLGVARAAEVRRQLIARGIAEDRITLQYEQGSDEALREPVAFELYRPETEAAYEREPFTFTNMTFSQDNFAFDSDEFRPGEHFLAYADSLKIYLEQHPGKQLLIVGHTDNIDTDKYNLDLGLRRAKSARQYLREMGITAPTEVQSQGERRPVATNETKEGRARNRRVNFVITDRPPK